MRRLTLKIVVALAIFMAAGVAYAEMPDVSKWVCASNVVKNDPNSKLLANYGIETVECFNSSWAYVKVSGELVYIYEYRTVSGETVHYRALKTNEGNWVEVVNKKDLAVKADKVENGDIIMSIFDDNDNVVAERLVPLLKK